MRLARLADSGAILGREQADQQAEVDSIEDDCQQQREVRSQL